MQRTSRRGILALVLVAMLVGLVAVVQLLQHVFTGQVTDHVARAVHGRAAQAIASAAIAEARSRLLTDLNAPGSSAFAIVRQPPSAGARPVAIDAASLAHIQARVKDLYPGAFEIESASASATPRMLITTGSNSEYDGDLAITVTVRSLLDHDVRRLLTRSWSYRLALVAPDAPLAKVTALIRTPDQVITGRWNVPDICKTFVDTELPGVLADAKNLLDNIDRESAKADGDGKQQLQQLRTGYAPLAEGPGGGRVGTALTAAKTALSALTPLPRPGDFLLVAAAPALSLGELRLQADFDELITQMAALKSRRDQMSEQVKNSQDQALHRAYADVVGSLAEQMQKCVARYARFRATFEVVPTSDPRATAIGHAHDLINPVGRLPGFPDYPRFDARTSVVFDEALATGPIDEAVKTFMDRLAGDGAAFTGVIAVQNPTKPLRLAGSFRGRWTMVVTGSLTIDGLTRSDPANDTFTVVHMGQGSGTLALSGKVDATVAATGARITIAAGTQVTGGLFLEDVTNSATVDPRLDGPEKLTLDPVRSTTGTDLLERVTLSPWTRATRLTRE